MFPLSTFSASDAQATGSGISIIPTAEALEGFGVTTFRSNSYVDRLNEALGLERLLVQHLTFLTRHDLNNSYWLHLGDEHHRSGREIVRLIIAQRGLPDDSSVTLKGRLNQVATGAVDLLPAAMQVRVRPRIVRWVQRELTRTYQVLLAICPQHDRATLEELYQRCE